MTLERATVFLSYSHEDATWAQAFRTMLDPLVRFRGLDVWIDTASIRVGESWHPQIESGIEASCLALLLVTSNYLASSFVMDVELPALVRSKARLATVLVGDCLWQHVPMLAGPAAGAADRR